MYVVISGLATTAVCTSNHQSFFLLLICLAFVVDSPMSPCRHGIVVPRTDRDYLCVQLELNRIFTFHYAFLFAQETTYARPCGWKCEFPAERRNMYENTFCIRQIIYSACFLSLSHTHNSIRPRVQSFVRAHTDFYSQTMILLSMLYQFEN